MIILVDDNYRSYASGLPAQITASLTIGLTGIPFSGSDIGWLYINWGELKQTPTLITPTRNRRTYYYVCM